RPRLGRGVGEDARDPDRLEVERTSAEWECDTALVADKLGRAPYAVGKRDVHRLADTIDDWLTQLRPFGVRGREITHILGGELRIEAGDEHGGAHDLGEARRVVLEGSPWGRDVGRVELERLGARDQRVPARIRLLRRCGDAREREDRGRTEKGPH